MRRSLYLENPEFADEWDNEKNAGLNIEDYTGGSNKYVWWRCIKHGHSWYAQINKRFSRNQRCPYCTNNKVLQGFNDLATTHPHLAKEWNKKKNGVLRPEQFMAGADIKVWWKCKECRYIWQARIYSRKKHGCPCCAGNILVPGVNDLRTVNPIVADQWDKVKNRSRTPDSVAANDNKKAWWLCDKGHSWQAVIYSRNRGRGCPYCESRYVLTGFNDLASIRPKISAQWDYSHNKGLTPQQVTVYSHHKVWWKCDCGHAWKSSVANRSHGTNCPRCENKTVVAGINDLKTLRPDVAVQWDTGKNDTLTAAQVTIGSSRKVWWQCERGHSFDATVVARTHGSQCPYCIGKRPIVGETDFATVHPELMIEWDFNLNKQIKPQGITASSHKKIFWRCSEGHRWKSAAYNRHAGHQCPTCQSLKDKHVVTVGFNDLATTHPDIADEWDYDLNNLTPWLVLPASNKKFWWKCNECGRRWLTSVQSRTNGSQCPKCNGKTHTKTRFIT